MLAMTVQLRIQVGLRGQVHEHVQRWVHEDMQRQLLAMTVQLRIQMESRG